MSNGMPHQASLYKIIATRLSIKCAVAAQVFLSKKAQGYIFADTVIAVICELYSFYFRTLRSEIFFCGQAVNNV
eukprot:6207889-Pleurochrysis_carterae.AAC.2